MKRSEREYRQSTAIEIESMSTNNPNEFWDKIRKLGPRSDKGIPIENCGQTLEISYELKRTYSINGGWILKNFTTGMIMASLTRYTQAKIHKTLLEMKTHYTHQMRD